MFCKVILYNPHSIGKFQQFFLFSEIVCFEKYVSLNPKQGDSKQEHKSRGLVFRCCCDTKTLLYQYKKIVVDVTDYKVSILNQQLRLLRDYRYDLKEYGYVCK